MTTRERSKAGGLTSVALGAGLALAASAAGACASGGSGGGGAGRASGTTTAPVAVGSPSTPATPTPSGDPGPRITVQRSGGFAGFRDTVDLAPGGAWTATNKGGARSTGELTADQDGRIRSLAADPRIAAEAAQTRPPTRCRDAFTYVLTVGTVRVDFVDCPADPDQPVASLALVKELLRDTIQAARPTPTSS